MAPTESSPSMPSFIEVDKEHIMDPTAMANSFNKYFVETQVSSNPALNTTYRNMCDEVNQNLKNFINDHVDVSVCFDIPEITCDQVKKDIDRIASNKPTGIDGIGIKVLKIALPAIAPSLTHIYNASITSGIFPVNFEKARVSPLYKR